MHKLFGGRKALLAGTSLVALGGMLLLLHPAQALAQGAPVMPPAAATDADKDKNKDTAAIGLPPPTTPTVAGTSITIPSPAAPVALPPPVPGAAATPAPALPVPVLSGPSAPAPAPLAAPAAANATIPSSAPTPSPAVPVATLPAVTEPLPNAPLPQPGTAPAPTPVAPNTAEKPPATTGTVAEGKPPSTEPSPAEMAIVQNKGALDSMDPTAAAKSRAAGAKVLDILSQQADIRPLPTKYLVVRKVHAADDTDSRLAAARLAFARGNNQAALELFSDLHKEDPTDRRVAIGRAVAFQKLGQFDEAMDAYETILDHDPKNVEALTNMLGLLKAQDPDTAIDKLHWLRDLYPANADVTAQLGAVYGTAGDYENALRYLTMADALKPGNPNILYNKAVVYDRMGKGTPAADLYRQIVQMSANGTLGQNFPIDAVKKRLATIR